MSMHRGFVLSLWLVTLLSTIVPRPVEADELPDGAMARLGGHPLIPPGYPNGAAFSPDGRLLAATGRFRGVVVCDAQTGQRVQYLTVNARELTQVQFTTDGKLLIASADSVPRAWHVSNWETVDLPSAALGSADLTRAIARLQGHTEFHLIEPDAVVVRTVEKSSELLRVPTTKRANAAVLSPDRKLLALAERSHVTVWDIQSQKLAGEFDFPEQVCLKLYFTPDNKTLLAILSQHDCVKQWNLGSGEGEPDLKIAGSARDVLISDDGRLAAVFNGAATTIFDRATGRELRQLTVQNITVPRAFSPDGKRIVATRSRFVEVFDVTTGQRLLPDHEPLHTSHSFALSPDAARLGSYVSGPSGSRFSLWDRLSQQRIFEREIKHNAGRLEFSPNGKYLAMGTDHMALISMEDPQAELLRFPPPRDETNLIVVRSRDASTTAEVESDQSIRVCQLLRYSNRPQRKQLLLPGHSAAITALALSTRGEHVASTGEDRTIRIWDLSQQQEPRSISLEQNSHPCIAFSADASLVAAAVGKELRVWQTTDGELKHRITIGEETLHALDFSGDGKHLACGGSAGRLQIYALASAELQQQQQEPGSSITRIRYLPGDQQLCVGRIDGTVELRKVEDLNQSTEMKGLKSKILSITAHTGIKQIAAGDVRGNILVWNFEGERHCHLENESSAAVVSFHPNGKQLICRGVRLVSLFDLEEKVRLGVPFGSGLPSWQPEGDYALAPDGQTVVTATPTAMWFWDIQSRRNVRILPTAIDCSARVLFTSTGDVLVAARHGILIWRLKENSPPLQIDEKLTGEVRGLALSPDGRVLASAGLDNIIKLWDVRTGSLLRQLELKMYRRGEQVFAFSQDGRILYCPDFDPQRPLGERKTFQMWEVASARLLGQRVMPQLDDSFDHIITGGRYLLTCEDQGTFLLWDMAQWQEEMLSQKSPSTAGLEALWDRLADQDPQVAYAAIGALSTRGDAALPLIKSHLKPAIKLPTELNAAVAELVAQLDSGNLADQRAASNKLRALGQPAQPHLRKILDSEEQLAPATRSRIEILLAAVVTKTPEQLQLVRAIHALERIDTALARDWLKTLADGQPGAVTTEEALAVLARIRNDRER